MTSTRADVAKLAGVSTAVVSYVVNRGPRPVAKNTRLRVERAIRELGYRPNVMAKALKGKSTRTIGLVVPSPQNPFVAELIEALEQALVALDHLVLTGIFTSSTVRADEFLDLFLDRQVDGLIVVADSSLVMKLKRVGRLLHIVYVDRVGHTHGSSSVSVDGVSAAIHSVDHLQGHGHRVIGCIAGPPGLDVSEERIAGWRTQQLACGFCADDDYVARGEFSEQGGETATYALLSPDGRLAASRRDRPSALFVSSDVQAFGVMRACKVLGIKVPEDVAIVSLDGTQIGQFFSPTLTSFRQPIAELAEAAARMVTQNITGETLTFTGNLVIGRSCGCDGR